MTQEQQRQAELMMRNIKELGLYSYELEEKREQSLLNQAGQMLTAFAIFTAALYMLLPVVLEHATLNISKNKLILFVGVISLFLLSSLVLAILAQWRYKYNAMNEIGVIYQEVDKNYGDYSTQVNFDKQWIIQIENLHKSKLKNNNRRAKLVMASMIIFLVAIALVIAVGGYVIFRNVGGWI